MNEPEIKRPTDSAIHTQAEFEMSAADPLGAEELEQTIGVKTARPWRRAAYRFSRNPAAVISLMILIIMALIAAFAPFMHTSNPTQPDFTALNFSPSRSHWFGTDGLGRDEYSRLAYGLRVPFIASLLGSSISVLIGSILGVTAGLYGGRIDFTLSRFTDLIFAFPGFLLALIVMSLFGPALDPYFGGAGRVILLSAVFALVSWPGLMRFVRSLALRLRAEPFVDAARVSGGTNLSIIRRHLLPNVFGLVLVQASFIAVGLISTEAVLSIFGLGVEAPNPDPGAMLYAGVQNLGANSWEIICPAVALAILILGFTFVGDGLRDATDTRD